MTATALYRALADAGANEELAKEAAERVVYSPEGATKSDVVEAKSELQVEIAEFRAEVKADITEFRAELKGDIAGLRMELKGDIADVRAELKGDIADLRAKTKADIADLRAETKADIGDVKVCISGLETRIERSLRAMTWRFVGLLLATQALLFAGLRLTGTS